MIDERQPERQPDERPTKEFRLDLADRQSRTWSRLRQYLQERQTSLRRRNDDPNLDPVKTALLRGELHGIASLLALETPPDPALVADEEQPL